MLKQPKSNREELKRIRSTLMTAAEIRSIYAAETCCSKNCMQNLINGPGHRSHNSKTSNSSSSSSGSEPTRDIDSYLFCQQVGVPSDTTPFLVFDQFLEEVRKPFRQLTAGSGNQAEANDQLRYYLVQKFTKNRVNVSDGGGNHNTLYKYQVYSLSRGITTVCNTSYIVLTGISVQAIDNAQRLVRNNISAESIILGNSDEKKTKTKEDQLKEAFEGFNLDYNLYSLNINRFVDIMMVPESQTASICVAFLAEWFELAGEQEV
jgi:hypothetical protein